MTSSDPQLAVEPLNINALGLGQVTGFDTKAASGPLQGFDNKASLYMWPQLKVSDSLQFVFSSNRAPANFEEIFVHFLSLFDFVTFSCLKRLWLTST